MILPKKYFSRFKPNLVPFPNLIETQIASFEALVKTGFGSILKEFASIKDYSGKKFELEFLSFTLDRPSYNEHYARENWISYDGQIKIKTRLHNKTLNTTREQEIFLTNLPLMTDHGTFVINGVERVIVPQLARSYGAFFTAEDIKGKTLFGAKIIPARGVWIEMQSDPDGNVYVKIDKKRRFGVIALLRVLGLTKNDQIISAFAKEYREDIKQVLAHDEKQTVAEAHVEIHKRLRDGEVAPPDHAKEFLDALFSAERYDLSSVGRFRFNRRFNKSLDNKEVAKRTLTADDIVTILENIFKLNKNPEIGPDDIDHLGQRRARYVGELLEQRIRVGMTQIKRNIQDRMSTIDINTTLPINVINQRPLQARIAEFFTVNQLSQFMSQDNVLYEIEHLRQLSALGPGGLSRERAGFEVRDVHPSHYGRVCPIQTPEGQNIGLILHLAVYARINHLGIIETPYIKVEKGKLTGEIIYLDALEEEKYNIAHAGTPYNEKNTITGDFVEARVGGHPGTVKKEDVHFIDVAPNQAFSIATSMIPFLEHDDANRALMGSNMQKQATPCVLPEAPLVATGIEESAARYSGRLIVARDSGTVKYVDAKKIMVADKNGDTTYDLITFTRNNSPSIFHQRPIVNIGDKVKKGDILADASSTDNGQIALGQNILVAFMSWNGSNYEDAIVISERLVENSRFTSIHIDEFVATVRETKLGPEITTRDIPNVGEAKLKNLDEEGVVRIGAEVSENDILVGKITPKGETELTPEERLLRAIFAEKARDVKDSSLRMEHGKRGRVVGIKIFSREAGHNLESGILKKIVVEVAQIRNISVGDKLSGRHGNKGVISTILPVEDMPFLADGTPIDIVLTPLGVPSRMNLGQILEMHLGFAAKKLGYQAIVPQFMGATTEEIKAELEKAGIPKDGRLTLVDGRSGQIFAQSIAVGYMYILKLHHMVEDKIHARSIGPYSLITQQPLSGKAQGGGQRFGEMEVWALEGYGAAHTLREMLTIKSDDITGRTQAFDSIIKNEPLKTPGAPASFSVMLNYLRGLALDVELKKEERERKTKEK
ncbi:MAG TPA: DNA-directed RNA polymerase subunit beta [Candidatus Paceibacterota bacterium]|nr:DNA-directed RNA polymerase subunit beta [Candidatus Paceibacterota bacterium]